MGTLGQNGSMVNNALRRLHCNCTKAQGMYADFDAVSLEPAQGGQAPHETVARILLSRCSQPSWNLVLPEDSQVRRVPEILPSFDACARPTIVRNTRER